MRPFSGWQVAALRCSAASIIVCIAAACNGFPRSPGNAPTLNDPPGTTNSATRTPFLPAVVTPIGEEEGPVYPSATPPARPPATPLPGTEEEVAFWPAPYLPPALLASLKLPENLRLADSAESAHLRLEAGEQRPLSRWVYALVAPFPTIADGLSSADLVRSWRGAPTGPFAGEPLLVDESTLGVFSALWGAPAAGATEVLPPGEILSAAWERGAAWAIVPFEELGPRWKVLEVDGASPLRNDFNDPDYALTVTFSLEGDPGLAEGLLASAGDPSQAILGLASLNRDPDKLTTVAMTGVTALVRATAFTMHRQGITYPAQDIGPILRGVDLLHISNEIPFTPDCPPPNPQQAGLRFCSDPNYIALLDEIGTDIVELTGDHFGDYGPDAMRYTLGMYEQRGWVYYGGGYNREDGRQPRLVEHNGNKFAFIGCNAKGGGYATASEDHPGAVACDFPWMQAEISRLRQEGHVVIATFQHFEYYTYYAQSNQVADSRGLASAGADIVSGSQAHQPQGMEFFEEAFIHYGLGNLFFDQFQFCTDFACDDAFIDIHTFYDGRYVGTDLITIKFVDYARSRPMTPAERANLLEKIFRASGW